ncbi:MAG: hypothetical protein HZA17_02070 [Nitrospirae bacterium]|nr:hypothetical protein [Nitrospirota bacterium]
MCNKILVVEDNDKNQILYLSNPIYTRVLPLILNSGSRQMVRIAILFQTDRM